MSRKVQFSNLFSKLLKTDTLSQFYFFSPAEKNTHNAKYIYFFTSKSSTTGTKIAASSSDCSTPRIAAQGLADHLATTSPHSNEDIFIANHIYDRQFRRCTAITPPPCPMQRSRGTSSIAQLGHRVPLHGGGSIDCFLERKRPHNTADNRNTRVISARRTLFSLLTGLACVLGPGLPVFLPVTKGDVQTREFIDPRSATLNVLSLSFFLRSLSRRDGRSRDLPSL